MNPIRFDAIKFVWRPAPHTPRRVVGTLRQDDGQYSFRYDGSDLDAATREGFSGYPGMEDLKKVYNGQAMSAFTSRLLSRERPDFDRILAGWGADRNMDDFTLLGLTFGRLPTDMYEFIPEIEPVHGTSYYSDLAGLGEHTHSEAFRNLKEGAELRLGQDPDNQHDCHAVQVLHDEKQVAHVKRVHSESVCRALEAGLRVTCQLVRVRLNGVIQEVIVKLEYS